VRFRPELHKILHPLLQYSDTRPIRVLAARRRTFDASPMPRPLAAIVTLGCKLNLADSETIARRLQAAGFAVVDRLCEADAFVLNTCSVTHVADAKSRRLVRAARRLSPDATVAVTGCYPRSAGNDAAFALGADVVGGTGDSDKAILVAALAERVSTAAPARPVPAAAFHTRSFIKAQEGCNDVCAFCIVPRTRGREQSRPVAVVVADVEAAVVAGAREVVITGTQLGAWGRDLRTELRPHHLIAGLLASTDVPRIRFSSLQPQDITPELLALWQDPRLMPHFHLALQSGSDAILSAMHRRYTARDFIEAAARIRAAVPDAAITTDVIAAFPGETDADFEATLALCREAGFARVHCFPYSRRSRTAAATMASQVAEPVKKDRLARLMTLADDLSVAFRRRFEGSVRPVLWEAPRRLGDTISSFGHTDNYIPVYSPEPRPANRLTATQLGPVYHDGVRGFAPEGDV